MSCETSKHAAGLGHTTYPYEISPGQERTKRYVRLPEGWRWRKIGERVRPGDWLFDLRAEGPVLIDCEPGWIQTEQHHAVACRFKEIVL